MDTKIFSLQKNPNLIFTNSPCVITMQNCGNDKNITPAKRLGVQTQCDVVIENGVFREVAPNISKKYAHLPDLQVIDASKMVLMPGLIDCHTHSVYAGTRANETVMKAQGVSYEEIAAKGGGISSTVKHTRAASQEELSETFRMNARRSLERGVVLLESKTGYGLNPVEERKLLSAMYDAYKGGDHATELPFLAPTYLGPHASSPDYRGLDNYIQALIEDLPNVAALSEAALRRGIALPICADIFLERNYFSKEQSELWLSAALQHGFDLHIHSDEFSRGGGAELAAELAQRAEQTATKRRKKGRVLTVDHCQYSTESDFVRLAALGVTAVALPATSFFSRIPYVDAKKWRASGVRIAIGSDFNPGSAPANSIWFSCYLALTYCGFSLDEVYAGVTCHAAYALGAEDKFGKIEVGRPASLVGFLGKNPEDFFASPLGDHVQVVVH